MRHELQRQSDTGLHNRPVTTWPIQNENLPEGLQPSTGHYAVALRGATESPVFRDFGDQSREQGELMLRAEASRGAFAAGLEFTAVEDPSDGKRARLDGSYIAVEGFNWQLGAGAIERWWGPGWQSSLILSSNARPVPGLWLSRKEARAPEWSWLKWVGAWDFTAFAGQQEGNRAVPHARFLGARLTFRPVQGLEIGLSRTIQWGGEGRPEDFASLRNLIIGRSNTGSQGGTVNPGNQAAGVDFRYGFTLGPNTMGLYGQVIGADEAGALPAKKTYLGGLDWTSQWGQGSQQWYLEATDPTSDKLFGNPEFNVMFEHVVYRTGYRYQGRNMASTFDDDTGAVTAGFIHFAESSQQMGASLTYAELNRDGSVTAVTRSPSVDYVIPAQVQNVVMAKLRYSQPLWLGRVSVQTEMRNKAIELVSGRQSRWMLSGEWEVSF